MATSDATSTPRPTADAPLAATIAVLLPLPLTDAYDYKLPAGVALDDAKPGTFVRVPLGSRIAALPKGAPESPGTTKLRWWEPTRCVNLPTPRVSAQPTSANPVKPVEV